MPNISLSKVVSLVVLTCFLIYSCIRFIISPEPILNMVGYVFAAITILTVGAYYIYKFIDSESKDGDIY